MNQTQLITYALLLGAEADHIILDLGHDAEACELALDEPTLEFDSVYRFLTAQSKATLAALDW